MPSSISRRQFGASLAGALGLTSAARAQSRPPNVLFLMAEGLRGDSIGYMGHPVVKTPNLDRLARGGVALRRFYTASPAGAPAQVSALSGRYPHVHGVTSADGALPADEALLPELLAKQGYRTGAVGDVAIPGRKLEDVFDYLQTFEGDYVSMLNEKYPELEGNPDVLAARMDGVGEIPWSNGATRLRAQDCPAGWSAAKSIEFLDGAKTDEPWFLFANFRQAQDAFVAPLPWPRRYPEQQITLPRLPEDRPAPATRADREADYITAGYEATLLQIRQAYFGSISYLDEQVGAIVSRLRSLGQLENTLIVFTADHGNMLGELGRMGCEVPYDGATHVPLTLHYEAKLEITGGLDRVADSTCLAPTILELAGFDAPEGFGSPSAKEIVTVVGADWDDAAFHELGFRSVRTPGWKLVEPGDHPSWEPQLFDLEKDPLETTNLHGKPEAAAAQQALAARLQEWQRAKPKPVAA